MGVLYLDFSNWLANSLTRVSEGLALSHPCERLSGFYLSAGKPSQVIAHAAEFGERLIAESRVRNEAISLDWDVTLGGRSSPEIM
ncbi:hypothetical protein Poly21_00690 [Allorhodopirellula heiligendammensis]|uniref:Uncharacterized protein n=2 Tax=Allorhodopirellula heiligendammensis TaxID=2714739 RepID=A0A5C6C1R2_9BACT|nr:hypothetical protein Poly21_00690 [Allorhodopirellula heiligendammensis]